MARDVGDDNISPLQAMVIGGVMAAVGVLFWVIVASTAPPGSVSFAGRISGFFIIVPAAGLVLFIIGVVDTIRTNRRR